jgi:hypothetical protein
VFTPVLAKHTKSFNLVDTLSVGVDRIQRNFEPMQRQVESWRQTQITDAQTKLIFYSAFVDGNLDAPRSLLPDVHRLYFEPEYPDFSPRTMWSLSNAFTSTFKKSDPQFKATATWAAFSVNCRHGQGWAPFRGGHHPEGVRLVRSTKTGWVIPIRLETSWKPVSGQSIDVDRSVARAFLVTNEKADQPRTLHSLKASNKRRGRRTQTDSANIVVRQVLDLVFRRRTRTLARPSC